MDPQLGQHSYDDQRIIWRQSLAEDVLRSLASDYLRGMVDESTADAFREYEHRWGPHVKGNRGLSKKSKKSRKSRYR
jgi:hypothetical protein